MFAASATLMRATSRMATEGIISGVKARVAATPVLSSLGAVVSPHVIGTHSGSFHCDEALACGMLKILPKYTESPIVRTRDVKTFPLCNMLIDVGAVYNASEGRFDHHQATFVDTYDDAHDIKLSSAGLIYKHFGREIVQYLISQLPGVAIDEATLTKLVLRTYDHFVLELDAIDNGVEVSASPIKYKCVQVLLVWR